MSGTSDPFTLAGEVLRSPYLIFGLSLIGLMAAILWLVLIYWTYLDARRRGANRLAWPLATILFPFVATFVYLLARPPEYTVDRWEGRLKRELLEETLAARRKSACPGCSRRVEPNFLACPDCGQALREPCVRCGRALDPDWRLCPYCPARTVPAGTIRAGASPAGANGRRSRGAAG